MWKSQTGVDPKTLQPARNVANDDDWETDPDFVNDSSEVALRWGSKTVESTLQARDAHVDMRELIQETQNRHNEYTQAGAGQFSGGYGGKFGVSNVMDKSAVGHDSVSINEVKRTVDLPAPGSIASKADVRSKFEKLNVTDLHGAHTNGSSSSWLPSSSSNSELNEKRRQQQEQIRTLREQGEEYARRQEVEQRRSKEQELAAQQQEKLKYEQLAKDKEEKAHRLREQRVGSGGGSSSTAAGLTPGELRGAEVKAALAERDRQLNEEADRAEAHYASTEQDTKPASVFKQKSEDLHNVSAPLFAKVDPPVAAPAASNGNALSSSSSDSSNVNGRKSSTAAVPFTLPPRMPDADDDDDEHTAANDDDEWADEEAAHQQQNGSAAAPQQTQHSSSSSQETSSRNQNDDTAAPAAAGHAVAQGQTATALYDYEAGADDELSFVEGEMLIDVQVAGDGWCSGTNPRTGRSGLLPGNYIEMK